MPYSNWTRLSKFKLRKRKTYFHWHHRVDIAGQVHSLSKPAPISASDFYRLLAQPHIVRVGRGQGIVYTTQKSVKTLLYFVSVLFPIHRIVTVCQSTVHEQFSLCGINIQRNWRDIIFSEFHSNIGRHFITLKIAFNLMFWNVGKIRELQIY